MISPFKRSKYGIAILVCIVLGKTYLGTKTMQSASADCVLMNHPQQYEQRLSDPKPEENVTGHPPHASRESQCEPSDTAIAYIAIGLFPRKKHKPPLFPWALHTLARHGNFCGHVMIITDAPKEIEKVLVELRTNTISFHLVIVEKPAAKIRSMASKSYKMQLFSMLPWNIQRSIERVLYLDSDVLVVNSIPALLGEVSTNKNLMQSTPLRMIPTNSTSEPWHGGLLLYSRDAEQGMKEWEEAVNSGTYSRDQIAFMNSFTCQQQVQPFPQEIMYFPTGTEPTLPGGTTYFVHYTSSKRASYFMDEDTHDQHEAFLEGIGGIPRKYLELSSIAMN